MASGALENFVREALGKGQPKEAIATALTGAGWTKKEVDAALAEWDSSAFGLAVPKPKPYVSAREAFLYLVFFLLLGVVSWNLGSLLFALIERYIPDPLQQPQNDYLTNVNGVENRIRGAIAGLVVGSPLFAWLSFYIAKLRRTNPAMQRSRVRKWLTYITLVIAACTLIGDAIGIVYNFLTGDLSTPLLLKMAVIAAIAGSVFLYFIRDAERGDELEQQA